MEPFLPSHPIFKQTSHLSIKQPGNPYGCINATPYGSSLILPISWAYIKMMGAENLKLATQTAILNANYMMARLKEHYHVIILNKNGFIILLLLTWCENILFLMYTFLLVNQSMVKFIIYLNILWLTKSPVYIICFEVIHLKFVNLNTIFSGFCAHEFKIDSNEFKKTTGVEVIDIAKRLQDYGNF